MIVGGDFQMFVLAAIAVFLGAIARRAAELDEMAVIEWQTLLRMFLIELMLIPAFAAIVGFVIIYFEYHWLLVIPVGVSAGIGGFATSGLIFEVLRTIVLGMANKVGAAK